MAEVQTLRKGNVYKEDNNLWEVLEYKHIKVARGGATIRLKVKNLRTGTNIEKTYNNGSKVLDARLESDEMEYLYKDGDLYYFMDVKTFEQTGLTAESLAKVMDFLTDNQIVTIKTYDKEPIDVVLPTTVDLKVTWAEAAVAGDTANTPSKQVELETGFRMQVPMFVKEGDIVRVDTREGGSYVTRVK